MVSLIRSFNNIPTEMQALPQWVCWRYAMVDGKQAKIPLCASNGQTASTTNPTTWSTFESARDAAVRNGVGLGYVFSVCDCYVGIDLDNKANDPVVGKEQWDIVKYINSYTEVSPSGKGLHIIAKAKLVGPGRRRNGIECYSQSRYFTMTGNICGNHTIEARQNEITELWEYLKPPHSVDAVDECDLQQYGDGQLYTDAKLVEQAVAAKPGAKFRRLWSGDWKTDYGPQSRYGDGTQSFADIELIIAIAYYCCNVAQTVRLFRGSGLGQRAKAQRDNYVYPMAQKAVYKRLKQLKSIRGCRSISGPWFIAN